MMVRTADTEVVARPSVRAMGGQSDVAERTAAPPAPTIEAAENMPLPMSMVTDCQHITARILHDQRQHATIAVTSAMAGEGASTVAAGVALSVACAVDGTVGLVDADLGDPRVHELLGVPRSPGLREGIDGGRSATASEIHAYRTALPNLWVLPAGEHEARSVQILTSEAACAYLSRVRDGLDYLIIAAPPMLSSMEAEVVCRFAGQVLIVARTRATQRAHVRQALRMLDGVPVMGAVLTSG